MSKDKFITDEVVERLERAMREGNKVEIRPLKSDDGSKKVAAFKVLYENIQRDVRR